MSIENEAERDREALMTVIRDELYKLDRGQLENLGRRVGRSADCLARIRRGKTRWPVAHTLFALIRSMGLRMILQPAAERALQRTMQEEARVH